ncbi:UNVERIFIED_CONTAM: hypothetical protein Sangu_2342600, partial [Sesamum angustifolium]
MLRRKTHIALTVRKQDTLDKHFKLHGYPDWFKDLIEKRNRGGSYSKALNVVSNAVLIPLQEVTTRSLSVMMSELLLIMEGNAQLKQAQVHYAKMGEFP